MRTLAVACWYPDLQPDQQLLLSTLLVGMMCGGAFALAAQLALVCTDLALYAVKDNGRGRFEIFALGMVPPAEFTPVAEEAGLIAASAPGCWTRPAPARASCPRRCPCR